MAKQALTVRLRAEGMRETLAVFSRMPKETNQELRKASLRIATVLATSAKNASSIDAQSAAVGTTVRAIKDRVPVVQAGGAKRITSSRVPAWQLLFGSEFGMTRRSGWYANPRYGRSEGRQFAPHQGRRGRWFFPTVEAEQAQIVAAWNRAADAIIRRAGEVR